MVVGYREQFQRVPFLGTTEKIPRKNSRSRKRLKRKDNSPTKQDRETHDPRVKGGASKHHLKKYGLDENSHPMDWLNSLLPLTPADNMEDSAKADVKGNKTTKFAASNWAAYSNAKVLLVNAGEEGHIFAGKFKPFTPASINQMIGTYILDGLAPSPRLIWKMQLQKKQPTHGNDFVTGCIGPGYEQLYYSFRSFFCVLISTHDATTKEGVSGLQGEQNLRVVQIYLEGGVDPWPGFF